MGTLHGPRPLGTPASLPPSPAGPPSPSFSLSTVFQVSFGRSLGKALSRLLWAGFPSLSRRLCGDHVAVPSLWFLCLPRSSCVQVTSRTPEVQGHVNTNSHNFGLNAGAGLTRCTALCLREALWPWSQACPAAAAPRAHADRREAPARTRPHAQPRARALLPTPSRTMRQSPSGITRKAFAFTQCTHGVGGTSPSFLPEPSLLRGLTPSSVWN